MEEDASTGVPPKKKVIVVSGPQQTEKCPLSGIDCKDCGYRGYYGDEEYGCFLREFMDVLNLLGKILRKRDMEQEVSQLT